MAASFSTLPFRIVSATTPSFSSKQQLPQQLSAISSSLRSSASSTRLPTASAGFGFAFTLGSSSPSPVIRQKFLPANAASDETEAAVEVLAEGEAEEDQPENVEAVEEPRPPRPPIVKLGDIMGILNKRAVDAAEQERPVPDLRSGDIVQIKLEVPENKRRASIYKGIVISKQNAGIHTTIRIRRIIAGVGVEIVFPVYSPNIKEIKVVKHRKVRRARLYYLRDKLPRLSTFK